jgi:hypothetical protein
MTIEIFRRKQEWQQCSDKADAHHIDDNDRYPDIALRIDHPSTATSHPRSRNRKQYMDGYRAQLASGPHFARST